MIRLFLFIYSIFLWLAISLIVAGIAYLLGFENFRVTVATVFFLGFTIDWVGWLIVRNVKQHRENYRNFW